MTEAAKKVKSNIKTAITPTRAENFPEWYQNVIKAADMAENAPVRGCMVIKPYGYAVWENIQKNLDAMIKNEEVQNAYFPLLIPLSFISKEAKHIDGFAKECAVVTHHRLEANDKGDLVPAAPLAEPMIIRPTSETIIGDAFAKWVQSYRDLPLKINQWANVMRWEMRPRLFLRTTEFLWQEGHNVFESHEDAEKDALKMIGVYKNFYEDYMAVPGFVGAKTPDERFPGAIETYTIEAFMQDGKALQGCTSHNLGQTFAHSAEIKYLDRDGTQKFAWTTSWGLSTRTIGGLIMVHADDDGMVMPPMLAPHQVGIIPIIHDEAERPKIIAFCEGIATQLKAKSVSVSIDRSENRTPDKLWASIKKGVPVRVEVGAREMADGKVTYTRRDIGKDSKTVGTVDEFISKIPDVLKQMHTDMLERARTRMHSQIKDISTLKEMRDFFAAETAGGVRIDYALIQNSEEFENIKKDFAVTPRCLPFEDGGKKVIVAKSY